MGNLVLYNLYSFAEFGENTKEGLLHTLLGMLIIFVALAILWGVIELFRFVFERVTSSKKRAVPPSDPAEQPQTAAAETAEPEQDDSELIAVITAAVAAYLDKPQGSFRVVSFKRMDDGRSGKGWNR